MIEARDERSICGECARYKRCPTTEKGRALCMDFVRREHGDEKKKD